jgi:D-alanyl-lipoteichoic acid acyltransferase DltB (MBOAT superfamily)
MPRRGQNVWLLSASYLFYGWWDWRFLSLIWISTLVDYICGRRIEANDQDKIRRRWLTLSIAVNLSILGFFKYFNFFADSLATLTETTGFHVNPVTLNIVLPVGISFYTFQTMSYTIDVYRRQTNARKNLLDFALFVAFFPQLVAGPIERAKVFLPQIENKRRATLNGLYNGGFLIAWGLFKKIFIADNLARYVDPVFADTPADGLVILLAVYGFAFQIYCDFSGYSDIARGCAKCLGFDLMINFKVPYAALNPRDFWRRWHISLSSWLRDYLYVALGGNRGSQFRIYRNLMITMLLGGLWHGANWIFVLWGFYHGLLLISHRLAEPWLARIQPKSPAARNAWWFARWLVMFHLTCFGWLIFRAVSVSQVADMTIALFTTWTLSPVVISMLTYLVFYLALVILIQIIQERRRDLDAVLKLPWPARSLCYAYMFYAAIIFGAFEHREFLYFQF